jgi:hypothetical protein
MVVNAEQRQGTVMSEGRRPVETDIRSGPEAKEDGQATSDPDTSRGTTNRALDTVSNTERAVPGSESQLQSIH